MSQLCALTMLTANSVLGYVNGSLASRWREVSIPHYSALVRPRVEHCVWFWPSWYKKTVDKLE